MDPWLIALLITLACLIAYMSASYAIYRKIFVVKTFKEIQFVDHESAFFKPSRDWYEKSPKEDVKIHAYDNTLLHAVYLPSYDEKSTQTAIVMHGYKSRATDMIVIGKMYNDMGFKVLLVDMRGHGLSKGEFTSFGHYEKMDLKKWILYALRTYGSNDKILVHGASMGAATAILASVENLPENVKLIVADSGFTTFIRLFAKFTKPKLLLVFFPGLSAVTYYFHRFFLHQISPLRAMRKNKIPIVILHGKKDEMVPYSMGVELIETSKAPFKELYSVDEARHTQSYVVDKKGVEKRLFEIINKFFNIKKMVHKQMK